MEGEPGLDDLGLFLRVVQAGEPSAASRESGVLVPTLSRKMQQLGRPLKRNLFSRRARATSDIRRARLVDQLADLKRLLQRLLREIQQKRPHDRLSFTKVCVSYFPAPQCALEPLGYDDGETNGRRSSQQLHEWSR